jgi:tungsten cofactor oxidoreducase radical SAM maturase
MHVYNFRKTQVSIPETNDIRKLYLELSSECNFDCAMCFRHSFSTPIGSMSPELVARIQTEIVTLPELQEVVLGGLGEPLLHPQLTEVISFLKQRNLLLTITTNGALLEPLMDFLIAQNVDRIVISCETGDIGHYNAYPIFETIKNVSQKIEQSNSLKPEIWLAMVVTRDNIHDLPRMAELLQQANVKKVLLSNLLPATKAQAELALYPQPEVKEIEAFQENILRDAGIYCSPPDFKILTDRSCNFNEQHALVIRWDGEIAPCYRFLHSRQEIVLNTTKEVKARTFGNMLKHNLLDIWNNREYTWFRFVVQNSLYPSCLDCIFRDGCGYLEMSDIDCWGNEYSCADCLWGRGFVKCP